ncbi:MAG: hypothetical protein N3A61_09990, partial [Ignavibacteria bacterium]|nr:hypothetical protein [Ignavibacteria bacterium]
MRNSFLKIILFIVVLFNLRNFQNGYCQEGSIYSRFGIGEVILNSSSRRMGIGGLGTASFDKFDVNSYNPASWTAISTTKMLASVKY